MIFRPGNMFVVTPSVGQDENFLHKISRITIQGVSRHREIDGQAFFTHAGIIVDEDANTFEALTSGYGSQNFFETYRDCPYIIARHRDFNDMNHYRHWLGMRAIHHLMGKRYPWSRIALHAFPTIPKYIRFGRPVCSEMTFQYGMAAGLKHITYYWGVTPAHIADCFRRWDVFEILKENQ